MIRCKTLFQINNNESAFVLVKSSKFKLSPIIKFISSNSYNHTSNLFECRKKCMYLETRVHFILFFYFLFFKNEMRVHCDCGGEQTKKINMQ